MDNLKNKFQQNFQLADQQKNQDGKQLKQRVQNIKPFIVFNSEVIDQSYQNHLIIKDIKNFQKIDFNKLKIQFSNQLRRDKTKLRMSNLQYFKKIKKRQHKSIVIVAKTILPSIKQKSMQKLQQKNNNPLEQIKKQKSNEFITLRQMHRGTKREHISALIKSNFSILHKNYAQFDKKTSFLEIKQKKIQKLSELRKQSKKNQTNEQTIQTAVNNSTDQLDNNNLENNNQSIKIPEPEQNIKLIVTQNQLPPPKIHYKYSLRNKKFNADYLFTQKKHKDKDQRLEKYKQFLFKINFANNIYIDLKIQESSKKNIYYLGKGNNSLLIKSLLKRRYWWVEGTYQQANFIWTQLKKVDIFAKQQNHIIEKLSFQNFQIRKGSNIFSNISNPWKPSKNSKNEYDNKILLPLQIIQYNNFNNPFKKLKSSIAGLTHNHLPGNCHLGNKKALFFNLKQYCRLANKQLFELVPLTFHVGKQYKSFAKQYKRRQKLIKSDQKISNLWIVKPGQNSNRGNGIHVIQNIKDLDQILKNKTHANGEQKTYIVQLYMHRPFLYNKRKFDIRHYMLITNSGSIRAYWYKEGYIRTSSNIFNLEDVFNNQIHLTNDAIQKYSQTYGKYQEGNKLSYSQFQRYLDHNYKQKKYSFTEILEKMKQITIEVIKSTFLKLDQSNKEFNFQIFGLDFMLDQNLRPWLIQVNTNPCLQISCNLLGRIIPGMVQHAFRISLDSLYPPPSQYPINQRHCLPEKAQEYLKFEIIFSSELDGIKIKQLYRNSKSQDLQFGDIRQQDEEYQDDGHQIQFKE